MTSSPVLERARGLGAKAFPYGRAVRWMDDIWLFGNVPGRLREAQVELQDALREIGLELNHAKTDLLEGEDVQLEAKAVKHSAAEGGLIGDPQDLTGFDEVVDDVLAHPEHASRTSISFVARRIRDHELEDYVDRFIEAAPRMPQGADSLARLFRGDGPRGGLGDWFLEHQKSGWGVIEWSVAQLATMFSSAWLKPPRALVDFFRTQIVQGQASLPMLAVAAHRLASWTPKELDTRQVLLDAAMTAADPLHRRVLTLAANQTGAPRATVRKLLGEFEENAVTRELLEARAFKLKTVADFG